MIYAVGDIHGRKDLLDKALLMIGEFAADVGDEHVKVVFLGDYVDRGPDSKGVVETIMALTEADPDGFIALRGNHEQMMIDAVEQANRSSLGHWLGNGGEETMRSYKEGSVSYEDFIPQSHIDWMKSLPFYYETATHIFVHAGITWDMDMRAQSPVVMTWVREQFLRREPAAGHKHVVHGHTPFWAGKAEPSVPEMLPHRTNLDTGAYYTGALSVGVFSSDQAEAVCVLNTNPDGLT